MKLKEFYSIDLAEKAYFKLHTSLKNAGLLENNKDYNAYSDFVDLEKSYTVQDTNKTNNYFPLYLLATPVANHIRGEYLNQPVKYVRHDNDRIIFTTSLGIDIKFPTDKHIGDGRIDLFIYNNFFLR